VLTEDDVQSETATDVLLPQIFSQVVMRANAGPP